MFMLDPNIGEFILTEAAMRIKPKDCFQKFTVLFLNTKNVQMLLFISNYSRHSLRGLDFFIITRNFQIAIKVESDHFYTVPTVY